MQKFFQNRSSVCPNMDFLQLEMRANHSSQQELGLKWRVHAVCLGYVSKKREMGFLGVL